MREGRLGSICKVRMPAHINKLIEQASDKECMTASEYVRRAIIARLKEDKCYPGADE